MTITLKTLLDAEPALVKLAGLVTGKSGYHVARLLLLVREATDPYRTEHTRLIHALGVERDATAAEIATGSEARVVTVTPEHMADFVRQLEELQAQEMVIDRWLLTESLLDASALPGIDMVSLLPLIADEKG